MQIAVGDFVAKCPRCGNGEFDPLIRLELSYDDIFLCMHCGEHIVHADLIRQLGEQAVKRQAEASEGGLLLKGVR